MTKHDMSEESNTAEATRKLFGKRVLVENYIRKYAGNWTEHKLNKPTAGIIIGKRTLKNGQTHYDEDFGYYFEAKEHFIAYLIAFDMYRKPIFVKNYSLLS